MPPLPLNDPRWNKLSARCGSAGFIPEALAHLLAHPEDFEAFDRLAEELTREGLDCGCPHDGEDILQRSQK